MPAEALEIGGTLSTFGDQVLSSRPTQPKTRFGTSQRTHKLAQEPFQVLLYGKESIGHSTEVASAFGQQSSSIRQTSPCHKFGIRFASDSNMGRYRPGPGAYSRPGSVGTQILSSCPTSPTARIGSAGRFGHGKTIFRDDACGPASSSYKPAAGWIGDAPTFSFHGAAKRSQITGEMPAARPTAVDDPAPNAYSAPSAFGSQSNSVRLTAPTPRLGTAKRDKLALQYFSAAHSREHLGRHSPSPNKYLPKDESSSRVRSAGGCRWGHGDRFSEIKPTKSKPLFTDTPGPGTYVV